jgi:hypothetical protein
VLWHILCRAVAHFVPSCGTFCAVLWHILCRPVAHKSRSLFLPCYGTFYAFPWHIRLFVLCCGTFWAVLWHISLKVFLCRAMAHFVPSRQKDFLTTRFLVFLSRIASQELQVKNCKSRIASQELQKNIFLDSLDIFFSPLNEWKNFQFC